VLKLDEVVVGVGEYYYSKKPKEWRKGQAKGKEGIEL
jgi:hypothetical protein